MEPLSEVSRLELGRGGRSENTVPSFEALYLAYREVVVRYLRVRALDADVLDLAAVTFERAFRAMAAGSSVNLGWLLRTARNAAVDASRRRRTRLVLEGLLGRHAAEVEPSPELMVVAVEQAEMVRRAVRALPEAQRDAIALRYAAGLSAREIGAVLGKSEAATQKQISRAIKALRETVHE